MDAASVELRNQQASQSESSSIDHTGKNTSPDNPGTNAEEDEDDDGVEMIDVV